MNVYMFQSGAYTGFIKGINGVLMQPPIEGNNTYNNKLLPIAESCSIEIVESESFRVWKTVIKKDDLDGIVLTKLQQVVLAIQNALDDNCTSYNKPSLDLCEETDAMALILHFPTIFGRSSLAFHLNEVEQDTLSVLQKQVALLRNKVKALELRDDPDKTKEDYCMTKQKLEELCLKMDVMEAAREEINVEKPSTELDMTMKQKVVGNSFVRIQTFQELCLELEVMKQEKEQAELQFRAELDMMKQDSFRMKEKFEAELDTVKKKKSVTELELRKELAAIKEKEAETSFNVNEKFEELRLELDALKLKNEETESEVEALKQKKVEAELDEVFGELEMMKQNEKGNTLRAKQKFEELRTELDAIKQTKKETELKVDMMKTKKEEMELEFRRKINLINQKEKIPLATEKQFLELCSKADVMKKELTMEISSRATRKFVACGSNLRASSCGDIVTHTSDADAWPTAVIGETMKDGKYYAEFSTVRMKDNICSLMCGILPSTERNLITRLNAITGSYCYNLYDGCEYQKGHARVSTGLPACVGTPGPKNIGVKLDLDENKIQFFLNGTGSTIFDVAPGEYSFALSLFYALDEVKLIRIEKLE